MNDKCNNCGHGGIPMFYDWRKIKRVRFQIKNEVYCPVCKVHSEVNAELYGQAVFDAHQIGQPCTHGDGGKYKAATGYFNKLVCKKCGIDAE